MTERELSDRRIKRKAIHSAAGAIDHHGGRPIDDVTGSHLFGSGLKEILFCTGLPSFADPAVYGEDGTDGDIHVDIAAAIQGVKQTDVFGVVADLVVEYHEFIQLFAADAGTADAMSQHAHELVVGEDIQFFYVLPLDIDGTRVPQDVHQSRLVHF